MDKGGRARLGGMLYQQWEEEDGESQLEWQGKKPRAVEVAECRATTRAEKGEDRWVGDVEEGTISYLI